MPKPKLTAEEKKALAAAKKAEKLRLELLEKRQQQHDQLSREIKYGKLTTKRHEKNWKKMLVDIALPRMRQELEYAWHSFERVIDCKDFTINLLMDELKEAEEQYMLNQKKHTENIDNLITMFGDRLAELRADGENEIHNLQLQADRDMQDIRVNAAQSEEYINTMLYGLEMKGKESQQLVRGEYLSKIDEETGKYNNVLQNLKSSLDAIFCGTWIESDNFFTDYMSTTTKRRKEYEAMKQQDTMLQNLCADQLYKLYKMQESFKTLKMKYATVQQKQGRKISDLLEERKYFADAFRILKNRLMEDVTLDDQNLSLMSAESNKSTEHLTGLNKTAQHLLQLSAICRKFETVEEKVLPFPQIEEGEHDDDAIAIPEYKNVMNLRLFWQRFAQASAVRFSLNEEREYLKRDNDFIRSKIHEFCLCLSCPTGTTILDIPVSPPDVQINIVDGNEYMKKYDKSK